MLLVLPLTVLSLMGSSIRPPAPSTITRCASAWCGIQGTSANREPHRRILSPLSVLTANNNRGLEEELASTLNALVRKTASHTVAGRGRDWRGVFERLSASPHGLLGCTELKKAVLEIAGHTCGEDEMEAIVRRYDRNGDGKLCYAEFESMLKSLLQIPHDTVRRFRTTPPHPQ
jgi:hypothetical protein